MLKFQEIIVLVFDMAMSSATRQERDWKDTQTLLKYLHERNPFTFAVSLQSISTGVHASTTMQQKMLVMPF